MRKKFTYFNLSNPYVQQGPLIVHAACVLADAKASWQNAEGVCCRSLRSCSLPEMCLHGCPFSPAHTNLAAVPSERQRAWASISLCGLLNSYLDLRLYTGSLNSKGTVIFFSFSFSSYPLSNYWRFGGLCMDWGLNFEQSHLKNMGGAHKLFSS